MRTKDLLGLATKNLFRHRRRTLITAGAVAVGLMTYIAMDSMLSGAESESVRNLIWYETGSAQVIHAGYLDERAERPLRYAIDQVHAVRAQLREAGLPNAPRTVFYGELIVFQDPFAEDGSVNITAYAIDPADDDTVYRMRDTVVDGRYLHAGEDGALLGAWLAEDIGAQVGYPITVVTRTRNGYYQTIDLEVVGIVNTPNPYINRASIFLPLDVADQYLEMDGAVTEIAVSLPFDSDLDAFAARMERQLAGFSDLHVANWRQLAADLIAITETKDMGTAVIMLLVFIIAAVGVSNTVLMSVLERTRELGMLRALGLRNGEVQTLLLTEAALIGFLGGLIGMLLGALINVWLVNTGIDYSWMLRDTNTGYRIAGIMYGAWKAETFVQALGIGVLIAIVTAYIPVRRALRLSVVDALRAN